MIHPKCLAITVAALTMSAPPLLAQPQSKIQVAIDVQGVGPAASDAAATLLGDIRKGLEASSDIRVITRADARRVVRVIVSAAGNVYGASLVVTERYDRETLMVLGIEDDDLAGRMMRLQIVNEHQGFAGADLADIGRRIVATLNDGVFAALRSIGKP
jgi:hypothetical protein